MHAHAKAHSARTHAVLVQATRGSGHDTRRVGPFTLEPARARRLLMAAVEAQERQRAETLIGALLWCGCVLFACPCVVLLCAALLCSWCCCVRACALVAACAAASRCIAAAAAVLAAHARLCPPPRTLALQYSSALSPAKLTGAQHVRFIDLHCTWHGSTGAAPSAPSGSRRGGLDLAPVYLPAYVFSWWHGGAKVLGTAQPCALLSGAAAAGRSVLMFRTAEEGSRNPCCRLAVTHAATAPANPTTSAGAHVCIWRGCVIRDRRAGA